MISPHGDSSWYCSIPGGCQCQSHHPQVWGSWNRLFPRKWDDVKLPPWKYHLRWTFIHLPSMKFVGWFLCSAFHPFLVRWCFCWCWCWWWWWWWWRWCWWWWWWWCWHWRASVKASQEWGFQACQNPKDCRRVLSSCQCSAICWWEVPYNGHLWDWPRSWTKWWRCGFVGRRN